MTSKVSRASVELDQQGTEAEGLDALYEKLADAHMIPLWTLSTQMDGLSNANWSTEVVTGQGRTITATEIPWIRAREVWIHAVDLNAGGDFADFPAAFVDKLIDEAVAKHRAGDTPTLEVCPTDREDDRSVSVHEANAPVEGAASDLARWLTRREARGLRRSDGTPLPELGPWL